MPKLRVPPEQKMDRALTSAIVGWEELTGNDFKHTSAVLGVSVATYYSRMKEPEKFTIKELRSLVNRRVLTVEAVADALGLAR